MRVRRLLAAAVTVVLVGGCGTETPAEQPAAQPPSAAVSSPVASPVASPSVRRASAAPATSASVRSSSDGWEITVYYTAVERFHDGDPTDVTGCLVLDCSDGDDDLGSYPEDFVDAVRDEGTGLTSAGKYLNWSYDVGFWLDSVARTSDGGALDPWVSAAADSDVLAPGTEFSVASCGRQEDGSAAPAGVCARMRAAAWRISDEFTPGLGGVKHIDAYIGPETGPGFTDSEWYLTLVNARIATG